MTSPPLRVLYEDNHLLAVDKPAMLPTMGTPAGQPTLLDRAREYIRAKYNKPGNVYLGIVSRLDAPVTGVVMIARTSKAAARLTAMYRDREVDKTYWAIVEQAPQPAAGELKDWVRKDERHRRMHVASGQQAGAQLARLRYRTLQSARGGVLVEITLETGRKHQIRLQLSHHGLPIVGDRKYGSQEPLSSGIALHARRLALIHPVRQEPLEIIAPLPAAWKRFAVRG